ncbi:hypothetical protein JL721_12272 [Aureococcus anophagefferens]|nr:hypothetical protein JL721_12272 [Aureococcus anophagefferens]
MGGQQDKFAVAPDSTAVISDHTPIFGCFEEGANGLSGEEACAHRDRIASYFVRASCPAAGPSSATRTATTEMMAKRDADVACGLFCDNLVNLTKDKVLAWLNKASLDKELATATECWTPIEAFSAADRADHAPRAQALGIYKNGSTRRPTTSHDGSNVTAFDDAPQKGDAMPYFAAENGDGEVEKQFYDAEKRIIAVGQIGKLIQLTGSSRAST